MVVSSEADIFSASASAAEIRREGLQAMFTSALQHTCLSLSTMAACWAHSLSQRRPSRRAASAAFLPLAKAPSSREGGKADSIWSADEPVKIKYSIARIIIAPFAIAEQQCTVPA